MSYKPKYFTLSEFDSPDAPSSGKNMQSSTLKMLDKARKLANVPFRINSGFRTKAKNDSLSSVGSVKNSAHMTGHAADIHVPNEATRLIMLKSLYKAGFRRFGVYPTFIHVDNDSTKRETVWNETATTWTLEKISKL